MDDERRRFIKIIGVYDVIIGIILVSVLSFFFGKTSLMFLLGIMCSFINFLINSYTTNRLLIMDKGFKFLIIILSFAIRIGLVCVIALFTITISEVGFFIFIAGYSAQLLAIVCYGIGLRAKEGV